MSIALPVRRRRHAAWGSRVCRSTERFLSTFLTIVEYVAAPAAILLCTTPFTSAVEQSRGGRLGLQQGAIGTRLAGRYTEGDVEIDVRAILAPLAADLPEKATQFSWVINKDTFALQRFALVRMLRFGHRLLSKFGSGSRSRYPPLRPPPVRRINHCEYRHRQHNRSYDLPEHHTRDVRNESGPGRNLMREAKRR
jgi:hypothetical protein